MAEKNYKKRIVVAKYERTLIRPIRFNIFPVSDVLMYFLKSEAKLSGVSFIRKHSDATTDMLLLPLVQGLGQQN